MYASNAAALHQTWHDSPENCEKCKTYLARRRRAHATQRRRIDALKIIKPACWTLGKPKLNRIAGSAEPVCVSNFCTKLTCNSDFKLLLDQFLYTKIVY
jgi:hypothetical protein